MSRQAPAEIAALLAVLEAGGTPEARIADWRLHWTRRREASAAVRDSEPMNVHAPLSVDESTGAGIFIQWKDERVSRRRFTRAEAANPARLLAEAAAAAYEDPDAAVFPGPVEPPDVPLHSEDAARVAGGWLDPLGDVLACPREAAAKAGIRNVSGSVSAVHAVSGVQSSRGCRLSEESTRFRWWFSFDGVAGESGVERRVIPGSVVAERLVEPVERAIRLRADEPTFLPGRPGLLPVLLHPAAAEPFFFTYVIGNLDGELVWNRRSAFRPEQFALPGGSPPDAPTAGTEAPRSADLPFVAREDLSVRLDPLVPFGAGSYRFTREGVPARRADLIASGRLTTPLLNLKYARRFGCPPLPDPFGAESLVFEMRPCPGAGEMRPFPEASEAIASLERAVIVYGVLGLHTQDPTSGEFSVSAPQSLAIRNGRLGGRVRAALSGNFLEALRSPDLRLVRFPGQPMPGILLQATVGVSAEAAPSGAGGGLTL